MRLKIILNGKRMAAPNYGDGVRWRLGQLLGRGGFGSVFIAITKDYYSSSRSSGQAFLPLCMAVKSAEISKSGSLKEEHQVLSSLVGCPNNIIQCFGEETTTGSDGGVAYNLLPEYASGGSLSDRIHNTSGRGGRSLTESEIRWYTRSILEGLKYIHEAGYVHCDLKPDNILLVPSRTSSCTKIPGSAEYFMAKLGDFGLAKRVTTFGGDHQKRKRQRGDDHQYQGCWRGTRMYLSPEALRRGEQETPSDIWSLGCIVVEMLTGKRAWDMIVEDHHQDEEEEEGKKQLDDVHHAEMISGTILKKICMELTWEATSFLKCCLTTKAEKRLTAKTLLGHPFVN